MIEPTKVLIYNSLYYPKVLKDLIPEKSKTLQIGGLCNAIEHLYLLHYNNNSNNKQDKLLLKNINSVCYRIN